MDLPPASDISLKASLHQFLWFLFENILCTFGERNLKPQESITPFEILSTSSGTSGSYSSGRHKRSSVYQKMDIWSHCKQKKVINTNEV